MSDTQELYQEIILDHGKRPRNFKTLEHPTHHAEGHNPLCGDRIDLYLDVKGGRIEDVGFHGAGCAISKASASLMTAAIKGHTVAEVDALFNDFQHMITAADAPKDPDKLGSLAALEGVRRYPQRIKCATLAWHAMKAALAKAPEPVSTERDA